MQTNPKFDIEKLLAEIKDDDLLPGLRKNIRISQDEIKDIIKKKRGTAKPNSG